LKFSAHHLGGWPVLIKTIPLEYRYDRLGEAGLSEQGGMGGGMNPEDLFSQLFGGAGGFFGGGGGRQQGPRKGKDLVHRIAVSLEDLYKGKTTKLALNKTVICSKCDGKGGKAGAVRQCQNCGGRGVKVILRQLGPMLQQIQQPCSECDGKGEVINAKDRCKQCNGKKVTNERKLLEVYIDKGMKNSQTITFEQAADESPGIITGDVVIVIEEKPHEVFKREGNDLFTDIEVDLLTALAGGYFSLMHLDDHALRVAVRPGEISKHGQCFLMCLFTSRAC
jgi:DnaJ family protein A protein 2